MSRRRKILIGAGIGLALMMVLAGVLATVLFPAERIRSLAETTLSRSLSVPVRIDGLGLSFRGIPSVRVTGITIGPVRAGEPPFAAVGAVKVRVALLPLFRRQVDIVSLSVDDPVVNLVTRADGSTNLPVLADTTKKEPGAAKLPALVSLRSFRISGGEVNLIGEKDDSRVELRDISERLSLRITRDMKKLSSGGVLTIGSAAIFTAGKRSPLSGVEVRFTHDLAGDAAAGNITLSKGELRVNGLPVSITGSMQNGKTLTVHAGTGTLDAAALVKAFPDSMFANKREVKTAGTVALVLDGKVVLAGEKPDVRYSGSLAIRDMRVAVKGLPKQIDQFRSTVDITEQTLTIRDTEVRIGKSRATLAGTVSNYLVKPELAIRTSGTVNVDDVASALPLFRENNPSGTVTFDIGVSGTPAPDVTALKPSGTVTLKAVTMSVPKSLKHPAVISGAVKIAPDAVSIPALAITTGKSALHITGALSGYLNLLPGRKGGAAVLSGTAASSLLDLNDMLVIPKNAPILKPWDLDAPLRNLPVPPALRAQLSAKFRTVVFGKFTADSAEGTVTLERGVLSLAGMRAAAYDGVLTGKAAVDFSRADRILYSGGFDLSKLSAQTFFAALFGTGDHFRGLVSGTLAFNGSGLDSLSFFRNLSGSGTGTFENGQVVNWTPLKALGDEIKFLRFDTVNVSRVHGAFEIRDGKVITPDLVAKTEYGDISASGTTGFNTAIDYRMTFDMNDRAVGLAAKNRLGSLANLVASAESPELKIAAKGTLKSPSFKIDSSAIGRTVKTKVREEAVKAIANPDSTIEKGKKILKKFFK